MKKTILTTLILCVTLISFAQKTTIAIKTLKAVQGSEQVQAQIEDFLTNKFVNTKRFDVVDRSALKDLSQEKNLQKTEDFSEGTVVEQSKMLGAEYLLGINLTTLELSQTGTRSQPGFYKCKMIFSIKLMDITTSQIITTETFSASAGQGLITTIPSSGAALEKCFNSISPKVDDFIKSKFPVKASIASIEESDANGAATKILISAGSSSGVTIGGIFKVVNSVDIDVDGKKMTRQKEVGTIQIISIEDENFSLCSVTIGGSDIAKLKASGSKLKVIAQLK